MDVATLASYERNASRLAAKYESADMSATHRILLQHLPPGASVLELGCGSGRDAAFLLRQGFDVTATDSSAAMLAEAAAKHRELVGRLHLAAIPLGPKSPLLARRFSAVLAIAVAMHLSDADLTEAVAQFRRMLIPGGLVFVSASVGREGIAGQRDEVGRLFIERSPVDLAGPFERAGFERVATQENADALNRTVRWFCLVLRSSPDGTR